MSADNVPLLSMSNGPSAVHFGANKEFQTRTQQQDLDSAFLGSEKRVWMHSKAPPRDTRREREALMTLLATSTQAQSNANMVEKLVEENISFRDLGSLTDEDLKLFGFASSKERNELINMFSMMPNQDASFDYICNSKAAKGFNNQIVSNAANQLMYLRSSLAATNYKLQVMPPEDVIVGDKSYASRFALDALNSVQTISGELVKDLHKLEQLANNHRQKLQKENAPPAKEVRNALMLFQKEILFSQSSLLQKNIKILYYTAIALGTACAWFWWWSKRSHSPNIDNLSVKI